MSEKQIEATVVTVLSIPLNERDKSIGTSDSSINKNSPFLTGFNRETNKYVDETQLLEYNLTIAELDKWNLCNSNASEWLS